MRERGKYGVDKACDLVEFRKRPASPICYFVFCRVNDPSTITRRIFYPKRKQLYLKFSLK